MDQNNLNNTVTNPTVSNNVDNSGNMGFVSGQQNVNNVVSQPEATIQPQSGQDVSMQLSQTTMQQPTVINDTSVTPAVDTVSVVNNQSFSQPVNSVNVVGNVLPEQNVNQGISSVQPVQSVNGLNTISPAEPLPDATGTVNTTGSLEEPEEKKKRSPVVILLIVFVLTVIGVALGIFLFTKFGNKGNNEENNTPVEETTQTSLSNNVINNTNVDTEKLNEVLNLVGIASSSDIANNNSLNYYVSNSNYVDNGNEIILYYAVNSDGNTSSEITYPEEYDKMSDVGACSDAVSCALISKVDAENMLKKFNLGTDLTKYFFKSSEIEDVYGIHYGGTLVLDMFNNPDAGITHNVSAETVNESDISIIDNQTINTVGTDGNMQNTTKNVTYLFKLSDDGSYHLDSVTVSE